MDEKTIDFATAQIILASMRQDKELIIYEKPLEEILKICDEIKNTIREFEKGIPEDLPVKVSQEVGSAIYLRSATKNWNIQKEKKLTDKERINLIKNIMKKYKEENQSMKKYVKSELQNRVYTPDSFLIALDKMTPKEVTRKLSEWSGYELKNVFTKVEQKIDIPKKLPKDFDSFMRRFHNQEVDHPKLSTFRDEQAVQILNMFKKAKRAPKMYPGTGLPEYKYVRNRLLPYLVYYANKKQLAKKVSDEKSIYRSYRNVFSMK